MHMATNLKRWTLEELHRLPDDGNKYELVRGDLFVTPPPNDGHETILARLTAVLTPYVLAQQLGLIYHPRSVLRFEGPRRSRTSWSAGWRRASMTTGSAPPANSHRRGIL